MFQVHEAAILARLAGLPEGVRVLQQSEIDEAKDLRQLAPFVALIYDGYTPETSVPQGPHVQKIAQEWYVVVGAKNAGGAGKSIKARDAAGELASQVLTLLLGMPLGGGAYLRLRESPGPEYEGGYAYLPIGFVSSIVVKGTPT